MQKDIYGGSMIRRLNESDIVQILPLFKAYLDFYQVKSDLVEIETFLLQRFSQDEIIVFGECTNQELKSFALLYPSFSSLSMKPILNLNDLYVSVLHQRQGLAEKMIKHITLWGKKNGYCRISLKTQHSNLAAQALYKKLGWKESVSFKDFNYEL